MSRLVTSSLSRPGKTEVVDQPRSQGTTNQNKHQTESNIPASLQCPLRLFHLFFIHCKKKSSFVAVLQDIKTLVKYFASISTFS